MKGFALALALFLASAPAGLAARPADPPPPPPPPPGPAMTVLTLRQTAEKRVVRDRLKAALRVEKEGADPQAIAAAINTDMAHALALARKVLGVEAETGSYSIYKVEPQNAPAFWRGDEWLTLTGTDTGALLKLAGKLQAAGLLMDSLAYEVSPDTVRSVEDDLTASALLGLNRRAQLIAKELEMRVVGYRDLHVGSAETGAPPMPMFRGVALQAAKVMPPPVAAPGRARVRVTVKADILLAPRHP